MRYVVALPRCYHLISLVFAFAPVQYSPPLPAPVRSWACDQRRLQVATATAALVWLIWRFRHEWWEVRDLARSQRRRQNGRSGSKLDLFRVYYEAFASFDWAITTDSTALIISSDSLSSRTTVVTPSFALSSVCLAYAPTVADFPWVSYLLISKGILLITSVTTTATTVNLGGCIHDDGDSFCFSDDDWTPRIQTTSRIIRPPYTYRDM